MSFWLGEFRLRRGAAAGQLVRDLRRNLGMTQSELAQLAGTRQPAISRIEAGGVSPTIATLETILLGLGEDFVLATHPNPEALARSASALRRDLTMTWAGSNDWLYRSYAVDALSWLDQQRFLETTQRTLGLLEDPAGLRRPG